MPSYEKNTVEAARLAVAAREHLLAWADAEGIDFDLTKQGILHIYRDKKGFDHAGKVSQMLATGGLPRYAVTPQEMKAIEPTLAGNYYGGYFTESDSTGDIHKFSHGLAKAIERLGVCTLYDQDVISVSSNNSQAVITVKQQDAKPSVHTFDGVVICAGVASKQFAAQLGDRVNIYPVKGYSITVNLLDADSQAGAPNVSLLDDETKLVTSRLGIDRFRVAGTAEFNGYNKDIRADRIQPLVRWVQECFPKINTRSVIPWAGLRPMMPNMMPRVGKGSATNVFYNTGHGHLGWTLSAVTADMVAEIIASPANVSRTLTPVLA
jgi:D-amino-acid dehydrogenase